MNGSGRTVGPAVARRRASRTCHRHDRGGISRSPVHLTTLGVTRGPPRDCRPTPPAGAARGRGRPRVRTQSTQRTGRRPMSDATSRRVVPGRVLARGVGHGPPPDPHPGRRARRPRPGAAGPLRRPGRRHPPRAAPRATGRPVRRARTRAGPPPGPRPAAPQVAAPGRSGLRPTGRSGARWPAPWPTSASSTRWSGSTTPPTPASRSATGWPTVYDITDDWLLAPLAAAPGGPAAGRRRPPARAQRRRRGVLARPGPHPGRRAASVDLIPNGVDVDLFRTPQARPAELPPSPVAVYVGTLHEERIDVPLLVELAAARPGPPVAAGRTRQPRARRRTPDWPPSPPCTCSGPVAYDRVPGLPPARRRGRRSPTWSTRSPRASTRSRPTSAWPPAGRRWPPRSPGSATSAAAGGRGRPRPSSWPPWPACSTARWRPTPSRRRSTCPPGGERADAMADVMHRVRSAGADVVTAVRHVIAR